MSMQVAWRPPQIPLHAACPKIELGFVRGGKRGDECWICIVWFDCAAVGPQPRPQTQAAHCVMCSQIWCPPLFLWWLWAQHVPHTHT